MAFRSIGHIAQQHVGKTRALLARHRRGEKLGAIDQVPTISCLVELDAFEAEIKRQGLMTDELLAEVLVRRRDLTPVRRRPAA